MKQLNFTWKLLWLLLASEQSLGSKAISHSFVEIDVTDFGAIGDGVTDDTNALRKIFLDLQDKETTQIIHFPANKTFVTAPLNLSSNLILQVDGRIEAITNASQNFNSQWPQIPPLEAYSSSEDNGRYLQYQSFIYSTGATNIVIQGQGTIDGKGEWWWDKFKHDSASLPAGRPNLIQFVNCTNVEISGVSLIQSPFWTIHPVQSKDIHIHHIKIRAPMYAPNVDGIDPDSSQNVLIEYNDISCGDDHIAIKAGRCGLGDSWIDKTPCQDDPNFLSGNYKTANVTIRYNIFRIGMGIAIGSEISGGVEDVNVYQNIIGLCEHGSEDPSKSCGWGYAIHIKTTLTRGGFFRNIQFASNIIYNTTGFLLVETDYQSHTNSLPPYPTTEIKNISILANSGLGKATGVTFGCSEYMPCKEIEVKNNWIVNGDSGIYSCSNVTSYKVENNSPPGLEECMKHSTDNDKFLLVSERMRDANPRLGSSLMRKLARKWNLVHPGLT